MAKVHYTDEELRSRLTERQYRVTQEAGTEPAFANEYHDNTADGVYHCVVCDEPLFSSDNQFNSGTGWPSFDAPISSDKIENRADRKWFITRVENVCANCDAHLGHVFSDGRTKTTARYCMNSASLNFVPKTVEQPSEADPTNESEATQS